MMDFSDDSGSAGRSAVGDDRPAQVPRALRFLVVDDNPQDRRLVIRELRKVFSDAQIAEAVDQRQLDEHLAAFAFDVVVTDYQLQWLDGIRVLQKVKQRAPHCPVIMFTATGSEEVAVAAMKQGLDDYIIKNVKHLVRLRAAVEAALKHATTRRRADQLASRLELLLSQLRVGVFTCSTDGRFLDVNDALVALLSCEVAAEVQQKTLASCFANGRQGAEFLQRVLSSQEPQEAEIEFVRSPAETVCYRLNARLIQSCDAQPCIHGLVEDVTRRKRSEAEARKAAVAEAQLAMLSPRECDVLNEVVEGNPNKVIARHLEISEKTVEKHRSSLMKKLRVRSVAELVRLALLARPEPG